MDLKSHSLQTALTRAVVKSSVNHSFALHAPNKLVSHLLPSVSKLHPPKASSPITSTVCQTYSVIAGVMGCGLY